MLFVAWYEHNITGSCRGPLTIVIELTFTGVYEHFMFPIVRMLWRKSSRRKLKNAHAEIFRAIVPANNYASCHSLGVFGFKVSSAYVGIPKNLHTALLEVVM